jgi:hypothetical protein
VPYTDHVNPADIDLLLEAQEGPCVSFHLPTSVVTRETEQDRIVLKNLRAEAFEQLTGRGLRRPDADAILLPVDALLEDEGFWPYLSDGLAIYCSPDVHTVHRLPLRFEPAVRVGDRFHLRPLIPLLSQGGVFFVITVSQQRVRLFEGTRHHLAPIEVPGLPADMTSALGRLGREPGREPLRRWQGDEGQKLLYRMYFEQIDRALRPQYRQHADPLVFAGVDYLFPIFRDAVCYPGLLDGFVTGNVDQMSADDLHARAWPLVEPVFEQPRQAAIASFRALEGTGRTSTDPETILTAARDGRIQTLFLQQSASLFGSFDEAGRTLEIHEPAGPQELDLIARAARWAYGTGATLFTGEPPEIPADSPLAAIFRYA